MNMQSYQGNDIGIRGPSELPKYTVQTVNNQPDASFQGKDVDHQLDATDKKTGSNMNKLDIFLQQIKDPAYIKQQVDHVQKDQLTKIYAKKAGCVGLFNMKNSCYMNTVLQCLRHTMLLNNYLFNPKVSTVLIKNNQAKMADNIHVGMLLTYMGIVSNMWDNDDGNLTPIAFKTLLGYANDNFTGTLQHDAHECFVTILDSFHSALSRNVKYKITGQVINELDTHIKQAHDEWAKHYKGRHSAILDIFSGQLECKVVCPKCDKVSTRKDPFMDLSLPLPSDISKISPVSYTIYECLDKYIEPELLSADNARLCDFCKIKSPPYTIQSIWTLPNILVIHLKRFAHVRIGNNYTTTKISNPIHYPLTDLDLSKYVSSPLNENTLYDLYAVSCHEGSTLQNGHYHSFCYNPLKDKWYSYNDHMVTEVTDKNSVITGSAYMLYYKKKNASI